MDRKGGTEGTQKDTGRNPERDRHEEQRRYPKTQRGEETKGGRRQADSRKERQIKRGRVGDGRKDRKAEERGREEDWGCRQWGGSKTEGKRRMEMAGKRWTDGQSGGGWGGEMNSPRGKEMDGNQRKRRPDMGHDPRGGPGEERKPETIKVVPGIWPGLRPAGEVRWGLPGISQRALNPCPFPSCPPGCLEGALPQS